MSATAKRGFTIVELLIVIVVIAILASISIVAYNGIQSRAQDAKRLSDMNSLIKRIEIYIAENRVTPLCGTSSSCSSTYASGSGALSDFINNPPLIDPINQNGQWGYYYAADYRKTGANTMVYDSSRNYYIVGTRLNTGQVTTYGGWNNTNLNYLAGN